MKRPKLTKENNDRIAAEGARAGGRKFAESRKAVRKAMKDIETDVEKHGGIYPFAGGKVTVAEVLRRARKSEAYLRKKDPPGLLKIREEVENFVDRANALVLRGARCIRKSITDRIVEARSVADAVYQAYAEAELEYSDALKKLEVAEKTIEELRTENLALQKKLSDKTVVELGSRRK